MGRQRNRRERMNDRALRSSMRGWIAIFGCALLAVWLLSRQFSGVASAEAPAPRGPSIESPTTEHAQAAHAPQANTSNLPVEAIETLRKIQSGERLPYRRDGVVFENRERLLPDKPRGYYHEYTVPTPGLNHRGARRIVTGGKPAEIWYYSADHYRSFRQVEP